ncbi:MAG TPA: cellulase family glycosylhydrolase, partial [Candidatus Didemnitutus sp.]|nr:cellulase family glycosylhydrolase [Candidatus Didemnitutus sp.]
MNFRSSHRASRVSLLFAFALLASTAAAVPPVELRFKLPPDQRNPFARELWADVTTPSGGVERLPVFFLGDGQFAVRARATERGEYRLGAVTERDATRQDTVLAAKVVGGGRSKVTEIEARRPVMRAAAEPARLVFADGTPFTPIGANLAWPPSGQHPDYYASAFARFQSEHLNWMRVWMAHWSNLNLDWSNGASGALDLKVAADWDKIIAGADERGVYVQLVLQHHGQYSSTVNSNWAANPWNASHPGGFLKSPAEFFTSPKARELTEWKYRYIVARWGYSPAIVAWELFNEVHWTDAFKTSEGDVGAWHTAMAKFIRNIDTYHHLVTTSTENLASPVYAEMDYFQPHLYSADVIAGARAFSPTPDQLDRPVFYGEMGDDHLPLTDAQKQSGISIVPPVWASLMGQGRLPAQPWLGADLIEQKRLGELGAVARFVEATKLDQRANLTAFSAVIDSATRRQLTIEGVQRWQRRAAVDLDLPLDGRSLTEFANVPQIFGGSAGSRAAGIPDRATFHLDAPRELNVRAIVTGMAPYGASIRISVDGQSVVEKSW